VKRLLSILLGIFLLALFAGTVWFLWAKSRKPETVYQTETPKVADIVKKAVATGSVVPRREVAIKPRVSGIIEQVYVEPGARVKAGDLIAKVRLVPDMVNLANAQNRVAKAKIALESAQADVDRNRPLLADGTISKAAFQPFETALKNAQAETDAARDNLALIEKGISRSTGGTTNTLIRSTIAGTVLEVPVEIGNSVIEANTFNDGTTIATVADMNDMIFKGVVDESEVGKLRTGMKLLLTIGAVEGQPIEATLEHIAPKGVEKEGAIQFEIRAAITPRQDVTIRANYSANADIVLDRRDQKLALNESLLQFADGKPYVEVETAPQKFEKRNVVTGLSDGIVVEVVSGVTAKDKIKVPKAVTPSNA
jgi:HlyD family secretion protein